MTRRLSSNDSEILARADPSAVVSALARFRINSPPPWLPSTNPYQTGEICKTDGHSDQNMIDVIAVRGPLHAIDGWSYLGRAFAALLAGQVHAARHLAYYAELRAALSILASSGIGIFNRLNVVVDKNNTVHSLSKFGTHEMAWLAITGWSTHATSLPRLIAPIELVGASLLDPFREFFPAEVSTVAGQLMLEWGFDLQQGSADRDERNWSSYQLTALGPLVTAPADDSKFLRMFWNACRPNGVELERHLLRILLEIEAKVHDTRLSDYFDAYQRLQESAKAIVSFNFLTRKDEPDNHEFLKQISICTSPAPPYAMMCRAGFLLRLATGMAEANLRSAGVQPVNNFNNWWQDFGVNHGLWHPERPPVVSGDLWDDIDLALEESANAPTSHRYEWISALTGDVMRICQAERAALWGLFR
ncbi:hypothetical protein [Granulibacter bethesdensis]|uniref:hypothetical protein n=1 Tax=Granulibacter bethesdensis TaxID=364410 RepID=UPI0003F1DB35|nr:hypothetical protein [Granulibacter bethesdensis]AHJ66351.1 Hypothetical protein GbCGDNIH4_7185 [Granulibacter bethesdensis CGDNIH4]